MGRRPFRQGQGERVALHIPGFSGIFQNGADRLTGKRHFKQQDKRQFPGFPPCHTRHAFLKHPIFL